MRVLFFGSGSFALRPLEAILAGRHEVVGVFTQPARPAGRGGPLRPTPVAEFAQQHSLPTSAWEDVNCPQALDQIRRLEPDVICVVDFGQLIAAEARAAARLGAFNLHASLLPELRGAAPINWAIIRGLARTGVTTFSLVDRMDAGPIYLSDQAEISPDETAEELHEKLTRMGAELVCRTLDMLASGQAEPQPQDEAKATRAPRLRKADGLLDFTRDAVTVRNLIHGTWPWPSGQAVFRRSDGKALAVTIARALADDFPARGEPGSLDDDLLVATGDGRLRILQVKPAGKKLMDWRDFVNGYHCAPGDRFIRPGDE